jgi:hypothetical protein
MPKHKMVYCSQCGKAQGPGDSGFSHCSDHRKRDEAARVAADIAHDRAKNDGSLFAAEIHRAHVEELKWSEA